jgi:hypothetical protein
VRHACSAARYGNCAVALLNWASTTRRFSARASACLLMTSPRCAATGSSDRTSSIGLIRFRRLASGSSTPPIGAQRFRLASFGSKRAATKYHAATGQIKKSRGAFFGMKGLEFLRREPEPIQICGHCGLSVAWGSGKHVNRIPEFNDPETR